MTCAKLKCIKLKDGSQIIADNNGKFYFIEKYSKSVKQLKCNQNTSIEALLSRQQITLYDIESISIL